MAKTKPEDLPTLDDFIEGNTLVDTSTDDQNNPDEELDEEEEEEEEKKPEVKQKAKADKTDKPVKPVKKAPVPVVTTEEEEEEDTDEEDPKDPKTVDSSDEGNFWTDVEKITGVQLEVDFGDVDPESAQGAALREQALTEHVIEKYIETLQQKFPRAYRILEHEANGGNIEDLITPTYVDYAKIELKEDNVDQQKQILLDFYKGKGFDDKKAQRMVEADQDSEEGLFEQAKSALAEKVAAQQKEEERITKETKLKQQAREQQDQQFLSGVKQVVDTGKLGQFSILGKKDKEAFYNFVTETVQRGSEDGYVAVIPVDKTNMVETLQQLYFGFKKGKLDEFITRTAETVNVRRLKRKISTPEKVGAAGEDKHTSENQLPTMADFTTD